MSAFGDRSGGSRRELRRVAELVRGLEQRASDDIPLVLDELLDNAVEAVPGAQYAGVTIARRGRDIETACAKGHYPVVLDEIQRRCREGPCLSAAWEDHHIRVDDLATDERWPRYRGRAIEQTPIRSIMSFGLFREADAAGALNFYAESAGAFGDESAEVGLVFAAHTALAWHMLRRDQRFRSALASRDIIGQAKGMLMERLRIDASAAFGLLKRLSQKANTPLVEIAQLLVDSHFPPR